MEMESIKQVLMRRDKMTEEEADELIEEASQELQDRLYDPTLGDPSEICEEFFGLEPDYIFELV